MSVTGYTQAGDDAAFTKRASNLSDLADPTAARANIGALDIVAVDNEIATAQQAAVTLDRLPAGSTITVDKVKATFGGAANTWPTVRPTSRTDICVVWTGDTDPGSIAIGGDKWDRE